MAMQDDCHNIDKEHFLTKWFWKTSKLVLVIQVPCIFSGSGYINNNNMVTIRSEVNMILEKFYGIGHIYSNFEEGLYSGDFFIKTINGKVFTKGPF